MAASFMAFVLIYSLFMAVRPRQESVDEESKKPDGA
jgi:hypothetical protein